MITATVGDLLDNKLDEVDTTGHRLYVVRDGAVVFYVGQSQDVRARLNEHIGRQGGRCAPTWPSLLGQAILDNLPEARDWTIKLWTIADCQEELDSDVPSPWPWTKDVAEQHMILARRPCFNVTYNANPKALPERYYDPRTPDLEVTASDFIPF